MIRRLGHPPDVGRRYRMRPGVYAVLPLDGGVLLTGQYDPVEDIQLPGGGIDAGESTMRALHREVFEETGWSIARPRRLGAFRRFAFLPEYDLWAEKLCHVYAARPVRRLSAPTEPLHEAIWMPVDEALLKMGNDGDRMFLARYFG